MKKKEKFFFITKTLDSLFKNPEPPLNHTDLYTLLLSVLLSARATDAKVNEITPELFQLANTPEKMVLVEESLLQKIIRPIGFYKTKAKAILALSHILLKDYQGKVPCSLEELEKLPGVGHKTASVVITQGFHRPAFPVDTHIFRCARRWGLSKGSTVEKVEKDLKKIFPKDKWGKIHLQIIYYARKYCPAKKHLLENCPICKGLTKPGKNFSPKKIQSIASAFRK